MQAKRFILLAGFGAVFLLAPPAPAAQAVGGSWVQHYQFDGSDHEDELGHAVGRCGDLDGDGHADILVGAPEARNGALLRAGAVFVYSGLDGSLMFEFRGPAADMGLGHGVSGDGDVNNDGTPDIVAGAPHANTVNGLGSGATFVVSGVDGSLLHRFDGLSADDEFGMRARVAGDVDADGWDDVIIGAHEADPGGLSAAGSAYVYSGRTGALLWQWDGAVAGDRLGYWVAGAGDVDDDGCDDLVIGAPNTGVRSPFGAGSVYIRSGRDGSLLYQFDGPTPNDGLGSSVASAGDVDADGFADVIAGAYLADPGGMPRAGSAFVISGRTGALLYRFNGEAAWDYFGVDVSGPGDVNLDGFDDLLVGAYRTDQLPLENFGTAYLYSGRDGSLLKRFDGTNPGDLFGHAVASPGDVNADGVPDLLIGGWGADPGGFICAGAAYVYCFQPFLVTDGLELSVGGAAPVTAEIDFPDSEAGFRYALLLSANGTGPTPVGSIQVPLTPDQPYYRSLGGWSPPGTSGAFGTLDVSGDATATIGGHPALASHVGRTIHFAVISYDPAGPVARLSSIARDLTLVP